MKVDRICFGVLAAQEGEDYATVRDYCLRAESLGYDSIWLGDHLFADLPHPGRATTARRDASLLETWTALTALVVNTSRIRLGTMTLCNQFRHPPLVAKMIATLDVISNGRLDVGIGAGWYEAEHKAYGYDFPKPSVRIGRMDEAIAIWKRMWTEQKPSFAGTYYCIDEAICEPKPLQKPHPPIWIGGSGEQLTLRVVARQADKWNSGPLTPDALRAKIAVLDQRCIEVGRNPDTLAKTIVLKVIIGEEPQISDMLRQQASMRNRTLDEYTGHLIAGTPMQCIAKIEAYVAAGISDFILDYDGLHDLKSLTLFAQSILPHFRQ